MYYKQTIKAGKIAEVYKSYERNVFKMSGRYKRTATPERIKAVNRRNVILKLTRILNVNFNGNDLFVTLTYRQEERPTPEEAKKELKKFINGLRGFYKKHGFNIKYVYVTEYKNTAIHHHIVINGLNMENTPAAVKKCGRMAGRILNHWTNST
ncbi:hypothetical protein MUJ63_08025 [Lachnospiraceae bacterium NSJ-143]|nr:hypothetical protein [Lachnospiraceae bacterium NSJ-143]